MQGGRLTGNALHVKKKSQEGHNYERTSASIAKVLAPAGKLAML